MSVGKGQSKHEQGHEHGNQGCDAPEEDDGGHD